MTDLNTKARYVRAVVKWVHGTYGTWAMATRYQNTAKFFKAFGLRVKKCRQEAHLTQEDMMEHGFSVRFYQRIEAGKPVHMKTVLKLADTFGMTLKQFIGNL